ncbi:response regulator transcription factor [Conexibacter sp. JD483]|uniref:response regulator transcription factor n=1 Tax=unclassified Conexibacter TaxID=2627773 RepID=UPI0027244C73|nr:MULTISPECIES: response regulator transcription factor [unclassified Conexibacter]MDO8187882.1 response regulator transcription factor [Conexibacter sp. CPCC 205706]MDO8201234.1 response regulator transcription factor [Conexibacter sp. CPCC 205762]MDR9369754.1 response regulator transcription factor [Conexibacter sp. JD483]
MNERGTMTGSEIAGEQGARALRVGMLDHDTAFVRAVAERAHRRGWECHVLVRPVPRARLAQLRLDALVIDPVGVRPDPLPWVARVASDLPQLMIVACAGASTMAERVHALELGVHDWLAKPRHPEELIAHVESAVRRRERSEAPADEAPIRAGELEIDPRAQRVLARGADAGLTAREFSVVHALARAGGQVLAREDVYTRVWGYAMVAGDRSVDVYVRKVRGKLARVSPGWAYVHTQLRVGYRFHAERTEVDAAANSGSATRGEKR